jgi:hypothetical protein
LDDAFFGPSPRTDQPGFGAWLKVKRKLVCGQRLVFFTFVTFVIIGRLGFEESGAKIQGISDLIICHGLVPREYLQRVHEF